MKPWMRTALAVALVLAIAAGGFFLPAQARSRKESHGVYRHLDQRLHSGKKICWT